MWVAVFWFYLLLNVLVPSLVWWRWGVRASLIATVVEAMLAVPVVLLMSKGLLSELEPEPIRHPNEMLGRGQVAGAVVLLGALLALGSALLGGLLVAVWSTARVLWRALARRAPQ